MRSVHLELISLNVLAQVARGVDKLSTSFQTIIASFPDCIPCLTFVSLCLARWFCFFFCCKRSSHAATCSVLFSSFSHGVVTHVIRQRHSHHPLTHSLTHSLTSLFCRRARLHRKKVVWYCLLRCIMLSYSYFFF